jgi:hypothetical protein
MAGIFLSPSRQRLYIPGHFHRLLLQHVIVDKRNGGFCRQKVLPVSKNPVGGCKAEIMSPFHSTRTLSSRCGLGRMSFGRKGRLHLAIASNCSISPGCHAEPLCGFFNGVNPVKIMFFPVNSRQADRFHVSFGSHAVMKCKNFKDLVAVLFAQ